jgi:hypothetical protein
MLEILKNELQARLEEQNEWLLIHSSGESFALQNSEIELEISQNKLLFGFLDDRGFQMWRVADCRDKNGEIHLNLTRNFGRENEKIRLVPRASSRELGEEVELARLEKANETARIIEENVSKTKILRVELNKENGRFAQIIFENAGKKQIAAITDVSDSLTPEILISTAILRLAKLEMRRKNPIENIWVLGEKKQAKRAQKLHALLRENWKRKIFIKEFSRKKAEDQRGNKSKNEFSLKDLPVLSIEDLWREKPGKIQPIETLEISEKAREIIDLAPEETDAIFTKHGETVRFFGLPFARVRKIFDKEKVWFGIEKTRAVLTENNQKDLLDLVENLKIYRRFDTPNARHAYYAQSPEAWLESILRRNIKLLDANLRLSPVYHQFRAERDKIDLLALRSDGRLVIIEIKTAPDREMIFQAADYWRKIELQRRAGNLRKARVFGDLEISDRPAVVYLVAPSLSFHADFKFFASIVSPEIEIHRFNLAENWRENLKVLERERI